MMEHVHSVHVQVYVSSRCRNMARAGSHVVSEPIDSFLVPASCYFHAYGTGCAFPNAVSAEAHRGGPKMDMERAPTWVHNRDTGFTVSEDSGDASFRPPPRFQAV